ncbi:flagellar basal-body MS-ring/collar protein FliF [Acetobacter oeni]|uniref:Flagellar M-ring protein n=1 Tax=Acetobacter oeni TaxID=304077 RepID=A0A511XFU4_9PROT|nr:flagellar basal-body MS-ring/collar protein FliF [Acetobacter oeni]MBB3882261.1 flagellar M-ring protein FliF [Acetobacter oeni]NHO18014.1 flagellar M-ring protein FliF [Acetobacter oeni]GBR01183.1 flagellar MS-ring protein [Acetobacter oeni LMG 21952]GEN61820.1 flagellar M-ring protein [Acetobacter oeni]
MKATLSGLKSLGLPRLIALGAVGVGLLGMLTALTLHGSQQPMSLLYRDLDLHEASQMSEDLEKAHIAHTVSPQGDSISVPRDQIASARLMLARDGLPSGGSVGYEIFDHANTLTTTQFEQSIDETRALEGELERSVRLIRGVRGARVHLVLPHREMFSTESQAAQASVLLTTAGGRIDSENVQAILNLVSAAVPGLKPQNISIIDNHGNVLARPGDEAGPLGLAHSIDEQRQTNETRLSQAVETMLTPTLGAGHVRAEAAVTMNLDQVHETQESYDPDQQVLRSQQTTSDKNVNTEGQQNVSVANNLPNANAGQQRGGSQDDRREETNNYEIGKRVRTVVQDQPRIARVSLAVMVDGTTHPGTDGKPVWAPLDAAEIERITTLAKTAIGYDEKRGDTVNVVSMRFASEAENTVPAHTGWMGLSIDKDDIFHIGRGLAPGLLIFLALAFFAKPLLKKDAGDKNEVGENSVATLSDETERPVTALKELDEDSPGFGSNAPLALEGPGTSQSEFMNLSGIDGRLKASAIRRVRDLATSNPDESLTIIRSWLSPQYEG